MLRPKSDLNLPASYAWCREICRASKSTFYQSFALLDRPKRQAIYALYAFARITDDLSDSDAPAETRRALLSDWRSQTAAMLSAQSADPTVGSPDALVPYEALWMALTDCVHRYRIPHKLLDEIIYGVSLDIDHRAPRDWAELNHYCYHVASTVGLACTQIWRASETVPEQAVIDCGIAFQLTNILRDVAEDAARGRIYIPLEILDRYEIDQASWLAGTPNGDWQTAIDELAHEAQRLYTSGWTTIEFLTPRSQRMFSLMWHGYRSLLEQILLEKKSLWNEKLRLTTAAELQLLAQHAVPSMFQRFNASSSYCKN